ncbi:hypothetical protein [Georgenia sp. MJ170]|uniref:hypothetical protein n=1 Tax=Georgenia sunbinii TaxID=3117728 RepID=UPI002F2650F5
MSRPAGDPRTLGYPEPGREPVPPAGPPVVPAPAPTTTTGQRGTDDQASGGAADAAKQEAAQVAGDAKESAQEVGQTAKEEARRTAGEAKRQAKDLLRQSQSELTDQAGAQQQRLAGGLRSFSAELDQMADGAEHEGMASHAARWAAEASDDAGRWLEDRDPSGVLEDLKGYARRRPGMFILAAAGAGLLVGRIARSLRDEASDDDDDAGPSGGRGPVPADVPGAAYRSPATPPPTYPPSGTVPPTGTVPPSGMVPPPTAAGWEPGGPR